MQSQGTGQDGYLWASGSIFPTEVNIIKSSQGSYWIVGVQTSCNTGTYNTEYAPTTSNDCLS